MEISQESNTVSEQQAYEPIRLLIEVDHHVASTPTASRLRDLLCTFWALGAPQKATHSR